MMSLHTLLADVFDYAGLFPPAKLPMDDAVRNYSSYLHGEHAWALGRFIVPVSRLTEFTRAFADVADKQTRPWRLSTLSGPNTKEDIAETLAFNRRHKANGIVIDTVEFKATTVTEIETIGKTTSSSLKRYVEIPLNPDPSSLIASIGANRMSAKVRTGGVTEDAFPSSALLAWFIRACSAANVSFKATAGLHHPMRSKYHLTYEPGSPTGTMHGFLNVLIATAVAQRRSPVEDIIAVLEEQDAASFNFNQTEIVWRNYRIDVSQVAEIRSMLINSIGSCSFVEPISDLNVMNLL